MWSKSWKVYLRHLAAVVRRTWQRILRVAPVKVWQTLRQPVQAPTGRQVQNCRGVAKAVVALDTVALQVLQEIRGQVRRVLIRKKPPGPRATRVTTLVSEARI
jgi:hypothetical protein